MGVGVGAVVGFGEDSSSVDTESASSVSIVVTRGAAFGVVRGSLSVCPSLPSEEEESAGSAGGCGGAGLGSLVATSVLGDFRRRFAMFSVCVVLMKVVVIESSTA